MDHTLVESLFFLNYNLESRLLTKAWTMIIENSTTLDLGKEATFS